MQVRLMMTDGGPHSPETLAGWTASQLIDVAAATATGMDYTEASQFRARLERALVKHHRVAQEGERQKLSEAGSKHLLSVIDTTEHIPDAVDTIIAVANARNDDGEFLFGPVIRDHFNQPAARSALERMLHEHFLENVKIERSWHADANPDDHAAKAFTAFLQDPHAHLAPDEQLAAPRDVLHAVVQSMTMRS
jgi:hypothetical protein